MSTASLAVPNDAEARVLSHQGLPMDECKRRRLTEVRAGGAAA